MGVSAQCHFPNAGEKLLETWLAGKARAHHQGIDEEADQTFQFCPVASRYVCAYGNVVLTGITVEEKLKSREERHKKRCALASTNRIQGRGQGLAHGQRVLGPAEGLYSRAR